MGYNSKEIKDAQKKAGKEVKKPNPYGKNVSAYGYRDDSPFRDSLSLNIFTQDGIIDMSNTGIPLMANGRFLPPYSGEHQFNEKIITESRLTPPNKFKKGGEKKKKKSYSDTERSRVSEMRGPVSNPTWTNPNYEGGGWLDKYQKAGTVVDKRKIPQSGVVIDKRTNEGYYFGDNGEAGSFPVLTGKNPDLNTNSRGIGYLEEHPEARSTPAGYYRLPKQMSNPSKDDASHYAGMIRNIVGIPAYGVPAPEMVDLAFHRTYNEPGNPSVFKNREKKYSCGPDQRWTTYGCINVQEDSYKDINNAIPNADTLMVIDSQNPTDLALLKQAQGRTQKSDASSFVSKSSFKYEKELPIQEDKESYSPKSPVALVKPTMKTIARSVAKPVDKPVIKPKALIKPVATDTTISDRSLDALSDKDFDALERHVKSTFKKVHRVKEEGGEIEDEEFFRRGGFNGPRRSPKKTTPKNIQTSLNFLTRRNEMLFGQAGPRMYDLDKPGSKWLDNYK